MYSTQLILVVLCMVIGGQCYHTMYQEFWESKGKEELHIAQTVRTRNWKAKNVILMLGDSYGNSAMTATRIFQGQTDDAHPETPGELNNLAMEKLSHLALSKTFSTSHQVTDSASAAFGILAGVKTKLGTFGYDDHVELGVCDPNLVPVPTIAEHVKHVGMRVGVVTSARVTHASPAAVYAKSPNRAWEFDVGAGNEQCTDIASQFVDRQGLIDVTFSGGYSYFMPDSETTPIGGPGLRTDGRNLINEWKDNGGHVVHDKAGMEGLELEQLPVAGFFGDSHLEYEALDEKKETEPSLEEMTMKAMDLLENEHGYFLMVEGARIDHGQHRTQPYLTLTEGVAFDKTIERVMERINMDETLIIVTADHEHAFSIGGYPPLDNPILGFSTYFYQENVTSPTLTYGFSTNHNLSNQLPPDNTNNYHKDYSYPGAILSTDAFHGGADVVILAEGPMAHLFNGFKLQSYIGHVMQYATGSGLYYGEDLPKMDASMRVQLPTTTLLILLIARFLYN